MHTACRFAFALLLVAPAFVMRGETAAAPAESEVIVLPKYDVAAERVLAPLEQWDYVAIDGFEILSNASKANTRRFVRDFCLLQQVTKILLPGVRTASAAPTCIVLCGKEKAFAAFMAQPGAKASSLVRGRFLSSAERDAIVVDFGADDIGLADSFDFSRDTSFRSFYLQYFRQLIHRSIKPAPPSWLEEGLVQLFANTDFSETHITFAGIDRYDPSAGSLTDAVGAAAEPRNSSNPFPDREPPSDVRPFASSGDFRKVFFQRALIPLKEFFAVSADTPGEKRPAHFSTQAFLFTHLCLYGRDQRYAGAFFKLAEDASRGPITEEIFKKHFGLSFGSMQVKMRNYVEFTDYKSLQLSTEKSKTKLAEVPPFTLRPASDGESSRISGEVLRLAGQREAALNRLIAAYVRGSREPDLLAALGCTELELGRTERARKFLETAVRGKTSRTQAYLELAKLRVSELNAKLAAEGRKASQEEMAAVQEPLHAGLKLPGAGAAFHSLLARTWLISPAAPSKEQYGKLVVAAQAYYRDLGLVYYVAELGVRLGHVDLARQLLAFGVSNAPDEKTRAKFEALARSLPPGNQSAPPKR